LASQLKPLKIFKDEEDFWISLSSLFLPVFLQPNPSGHGTWHFRPGAVSPKERKKEAEAWFNVN
jgi:hypothetical protein